MTRAVVLALALAATSCGSLAQVRLGGEARTHPDAAVVRSYVCSGDDDAARLYLAAPAFAWLGPALERYVTDARDQRLAGRCPCLGKTCEERAAARAKP